MRSIPSRAVVRQPSPQYAEYYARRGVTISQELANEQHSRYVSALEAAGLKLEFVTTDDAFPDCVFIEDTAVVWDQKALVTRMAPHREGEQAAVESRLHHTHEIVRLPADATLDGGDVLHVEQMTYVGLSSRTNEAGVRAVAAFLAQFGRKVIPVPVRHCLHLKSAATYLGNGAILAAPDMIDLGVFSGWKVILTDETEKHAANCLRIRHRLLMLDGYPATLGRVRRFAEAHAVQITALAMSEFEKGDGSLTCLSLIW